MQASGQWRFTPPTHVVAALASALSQYRAEGGLPARAARYRANCRALVAGMRSLGLTPFLGDEVQAPIIVTFHSPTHPAYAFKTFYARMRDSGFILYPGKLTRVDTFRVGCIGAISAAEIHAMVEAARRAFHDMGIPAAEVDAA